MTGELVDGELGEAIICAFIPGEKQASVAARIKFRSVNRSSVKNLVL
jgi:hypothetical protein